MKTNRFLLIAFLWFAFMNIVAAQGFVEGTVYEENNGVKTPLPGVNVYWKIVNQGTVTDANGLTASKAFDIQFNEKPNAKFIGHYEGDALFTGIMKAEVTGLDPVEQEVTDRAVPVILELRDGETMTDVIGNCKINDQDMEIKGTVEGNKVTFEVVNTTVSYNYDMNGFNFPLEMNVTYAVTGTLDNENLTLNGTCNGEGEIHLLFYNGTTSIDGTIGGSLVKQ